VAFKKELTFINKAIEDRRVFTYLSYDINLRHSTIGPVEFNIIVDVTFIHLGINCSTRVYFKPTCVGMCICNNGEVSTISYDSFPKHFIQYFERYIK
jgi:hypothetical protein